MTTFLPIASDGDFDAVLAASQVEPVIVFKHSQTCGVSLLVRDRLHDGTLPAPVHEVVVQRHRAVSTAIATTLGVRHESPQVFVIAGGKVAWHSSHNGVASDRIAAAWQRAADTLTTTTASAR